MDFPTSFSFEDFKIILTHPENCGWGGMTYAILEDAYGGYETKRVHTERVEEKIEDQREHNVNGYAQPIACRLRQEIFASDEDPLLDDLNEAQMRDDVEIH